MKAFRILQLLLLIALLSVGLQGQSKTQSPTATYQHGFLVLRIPYQTAHRGSGTLSVELLDPEDHILGRAERAASTAEGSGAWRQRITPNKPLAIEDLVWERIHYRFAGSDNKSAAIEGTESVSQILSRPVVRILGQKSYLAGSDAAIRVVVTDSNNQEIRGRGTARVELLVPNREPEALFSGDLNRHGTTEAHLRFPSGLSGSYQLHFIAETSIGSAEFKQAVKLEDKASILLTTEKPIYQPGQTVHVRSLALDRADHKAESGRGITFEMEDSRGNKVFKQVTTTDKFGVASTEFTLADEVNLGTYHLRALMSNSAGEPANRAEVALNVERYVLPKFKVGVEFAEKGGKPKKDYRPGEHVTGTIRANYFFGKPVDSAGIIVKTSAMDVSVFEASSVAGKTDKDGNYQFDLKLPNYFAGRPISAGAARVLVEATVKDSVGHEETRGEPITVSQQALLVTAIPEGGSLIPHLDNLVFILTAYPDGTPAIASVTVHRNGAPDQHTVTDHAGVAMIHFAAGAGNESLNIDVDDHHGSPASVANTLQSRGGTDQILLRTERAVYRTGDRIQLKVLSTRGRGTAYVDIVKDGQTILTRDLDIESGRAELALTATPAMAGTLDINAYQFGRDAQTIGDHRLVFVQPPDELKIETTADASDYKPGGEAHVRFRVTNARGEGVSAAIGLQVVDEAVFALAEKQPGFAKIFFYLEQEAMKPRFEIHAISMPDVVSPVSSLQNESSEEDLPARALFSATEMTHPDKLDTEFGRTLPQERSAEYAQRYQAAFVMRINKLIAKLSDAISKGHANEGVTRAFADLSEKDAPETRDAWGTKIHLDPTGWAKPNDRSYRATSAGPDRRFGDGDDLIVYVEDRSASSIAHPRYGSMSLHIEHEYGPFISAAEVTGTVIDASGAVMPGATVRLHNASGLNIRITHTDQTGKFMLAAIPMGRFTIEISAPGFEVAKRGFTVQARDRAVIAATLSVGQTNEMVEVQAQVPLLQTMSAGIGTGTGGGVGPGVVGGVLGSVMSATPARVTKASTYGRNYMDSVGIANASSDASGTSASHVRSYFLEALYVNPEIVTDGKGFANITIPIADSITTWRMAMLASTVAGSLGTGISSLKVFQDFFVDLDLPVTLTRGDRVSIPVAIYNYAGKAGEVSLKLQPDEWFSLVDDTSEKTVAVESGRVGSSQFTLETRRIGKFRLTLSARMQGTEKEDVVVREIEVIPNGREQNIVFNGRLESSVQHTLSFPSSSIPDAKTIFVRLYPGPLSQIIEGMDSILRMPGGCFEQTSSSTYPNVLALDYMKQTKKLTPEVHTKAEGYIANGYQRLLTFEVPGGGFSWFGQAPANKILTAYGLMEFNDMSKVYEVDPKVIDRTSNWLASQQQPDGSWKPDTNFINEGATNHYNSDVLRITAYIAWALENTGYQGPAVDKAKHFIETNITSTLDTYTLAIIANFAAEYGTDREFTQHSMQLLLDARTGNEEQVWWTAEETGVYSTGSSAAIETTGLAAQALLKWGQASETARKALTYIASKKDASGAWGSTQATIIALRAMLLSTQMTASNTHGKVQVLLNDKVVQTLQLTADNSDLLHQFVFKEIDARESNSVQIRFDGTGGLAYQIVGRYFVPWKEKETGEALSIDVNYDRTKLAQNDIATATATVKNNFNKTAKMVMIDLGIPPGFELLSEDLQDFQEKTHTATNGRMEKFSLTATQAILYFNSLAPNQSLTLKFRLRAKYPIRAQTFQSRVYEYYDPEVSATAPPAQLEIVKH